MKINGLSLLAVVALAACGSQYAAAQGTARAAAPDKFEAGKHYQVLPAPQPSGAAPGKVEVAEVFMYGCPHCFAFEPHIQEWLKKKADYVTFVRIPAPWNPAAQLHARAFYTAEMLGKSGVIDEPFFNAFHNEHNYLDTPEKLADFFAQFGVDRDTFQKTFNSFGVDAKVSRANDLITRYKVTGTPAVVVNGKYLTNGQMSGSYENWFAIIDELAAKEHAAAH
ncbi:MAG TPA: thiol:disulfide interchange protein DsbA/DsbL [Gammaproteobacteria bacterium]|nr:thiol:disulfide interchange protein DsbA/DsbL [Gammaproteobacteria bacterium]